MCSQNGTAEPFNSAALTFHLALCWTQIRLWWLDTGSRPHHLLQPLIYKRRQRENGLLQKMGWHKETIDIKPCKIWMELEKKLYYVISKTVFVLYLWCSKWKKKSLIAGHRIDLQSCFFMNNPTSANNATTKLKL